MTINPRTQQAYQLLHDGVLALSRAEMQGIRIDLDYIAKKKNFLTRKINNLEREFKRSKFFRHWEHTVKSKVNINSNQQLAHFLYEVKGLKPTKTTKYSEQGSTDEEALRQLRLPELTDLLEMRKLKKVRDTYLTAFEREQVHGYIHPFFNLHLVKTFRSSSDSPNFQNIPKRDEEAMTICRRAIYPRPGHQLLEVDYSGIEIRINACYNHDFTLIKYIEDPKSDMHSDMAKQIFMMDKFDKSLPSHYVLRQAAKNGFVFPEFYGDYYKNCAVGLADWGKLSQGRWRAGQGIELGEGTLSEHLISKGIKSFDKFTNHIKEIETDFWKNRFPYYQKWKEQWWSLYKKYGYIDLKTGFRCSGVMGYNDAINYPGQGTAFHCLLWSFIETDKLILDQKLDSKLVGQIHDSMLLDVNPKELDYLIPQIKRITCEKLPAAWDWICVPLDVDVEICPVDGSWADKE